MRTEQLVELFRSSPLDSVSSFKSRVVRYVFFGPWALHDDELSELGPRLQPRAPSSDGWDVASCVTSETHQIIASMLAAFSSFSAGSAGLILPSMAISPRVATDVKMMAVVDEFSVSRVIKDVRVFDGDYAEDIRDLVTMVANEAIADKGSFSLAVPGGSVVAALGGLESDAFDFSKTHIFFCNEKIPTYPCLEGALKETQKIGIPDENVHGIDKSGSPAEVAAAYSKLLQTHPSIDNDAPVPSVDLMLLGTGGDGHCGCLFPDSAEIKQTGEGKVVVAGNDDRADGDFVAVTMDVMCAAKIVLVSAAGSGRAEMVKKALSGEFGAYDCPAGMVEAQDETIWFTDVEGVAEFDAEGIEDVEDEE